MNNRSKTVMVAAVIVIVLLASFLHCGGEDDDLSGEVFIVHTNDTHGHYNDNLGFGKVAALGDDLESRGATVFLMDAGDAFQGSVETMLSHGAYSVTIMNAVGYDVMTPGNHEFDYTLETYLDNEAGLGFETVSSNIVWKDTGESVFPEYVVLEKDSFRIGVFGLTTPDTVNLVSPGYLDEIEFTDPTEAAQRMVDTLSDMEVDWIVALGHIGVGNDSEYNSDAICADVDGIDVFIDGHSHTVMTGGMVADGSVVLQESDTIIASTGDSLNHIGLVCLTGDDGPTAELVSSYDRSSEYVDTVVDRIMSENDEMLSRVVGHTEVLLTGERTASRLGEVGLGDFVTDALMNVSGADISVFNGGGIRSDIPPGDITLRDVYNSFPFENYIVTKTLTGSQVVSLIELGLSGLPSAEGSFLQVGGILVTYDSSQPSGHRVVSLTLSDGSPLDPDGKYVVASNDYVMAGGDDYDLLSEIPADGSFGLVSDALIEMFGSVGNITQNTDGRLIDTSDGTRSPNLSEYS